MLSTWPFTRWTLTCTFFPKRSTCWSKCSASVSSSWTHHCLIAKSMPRGLPDQKNRIRLDKIDRILKFKVSRTRTDLFLLNLTCPHLFEFWIELGNGATLPSPQSDLMVHLPQIREDHIKFTNELAHTTATKYESTTTSPLQPIDYFLSFFPCRLQEEMRWPDEMMELVFRGLQLLSEWINIAQSLTAGSSFIRWIIIKTSLSRGWRIRKGRSIAILQLWWKIVFNQHLL